jgi:glyoxylase-like metal-dependent hydrolase (beta-lactamase superfamily II)
MRDGWQELAHGVYQCTFESWHLNVGLVVGEGRAAVVDTRATPRQGRELRKSIRRVTDRELVVINTHAHLDHCLGNTAFRDVEMLAHPAAVATMRSRWPDRVDDPKDGSSVADKEVPFALPSEAVALPTDLDLGGRFVTVRHHGRGHTDGDLVVEALGAGIAFAGDLIRQDRAPWFGDAHLLEWPATLALMLALHTDPMTWIPGHGTPMSDEDVHDQAAFLDEIANVVTRSWHRGLPHSEAARALALTPANAERAATQGYRDLDARFRAGREPS